MDPTFNEAYKAMFAGSEGGVGGGDSSVEECELPVVDLGRLKDGAAAAEESKKKIVRACEEWGFFQVVNHGISKRLFGEMRVKQMELFKEPFERKKQADKFMNLPAGSYQWAKPTPNSFHQISWFEAFQLPLSDILGSIAAPSDDPLNLRSTVEEYAVKVSSLAQKLAAILAENLGSSPKFFVENCAPSTCHLRLNHYSPCPLDPAQIFGLLPHTDSHFLTLLHQDQVGGLQVLKDGHWIAVKPDPDALIVNIGDFFQVWSNDVYKSVQHRVVANSKVERFSVAYFFTPLKETVIKSERRAEAAVYRRFSVREFMNQNEEDLKNYGYKIGLPRFAL